MYLSRVQIDNFRLIQHLDLVLHNGLNILLGENDSGKTAIIDAIRLAIGTRDFDRINISKDDFFVDGTGRTTNLKIILEFLDLSDEEAKIFLEWLGIKNKRPDGTLEYFLQVILTANRKEVKNLSNKYDREINYSLTAGPDDIGINLSSEIRDFLRATYLKPLRDAEQELASRKGSRLSQILIAHPEIRQQEGSTDENSIPGIVHIANDRVKQHPSIQNRSNALNQNLSNFSLGADTISASINISDPSLKNILERLELTLVDEIPEIQTNHGLGVNNLLFMATEMLLLGSNNSSELPLVLIEEPEAHLHPQLQIRLMEFLQQKTNNQGETRPVQVIVTSHSPNLASKVGLENVVLVHSGKVYPLSSSYTRLDQSDYRFLERFLDVTKANLFFARGVVIVEGDAEQILLPTIAKIIGLPFEKFGVSIVNVGSVGLFRYARIFQRKDGSPIGIHVACLTDLDIPPDEAKGYLTDKERPTQSNFTLEQKQGIKVAKESRAAGEPVMVFVSPQWTMEFDLCLQDPKNTILVHQAIQLAKASKNKNDNLLPEEIEQIKNNAIQELDQWNAAGVTPIQIATNIYKDLYLKRASKPETAQYLARLLIETYADIPIEEVRKLFPEYIISAITYACQ